MTLTKSSFYSLCAALFICFSYSNMLSQNLVPNGGFEEVISCPSLVGNVTDECAFWYASLINDDDLDPTPDWFHTCSDEELYSPPELVFGYQAPYSGEGIVALIAYNGEQSNYREIIGVELDEHLVVGNTYLVEFKVSGVERPEVHIPSNNIGFNFSTNEFYNYSDFPNNISHYTSEEIISIGEWSIISEEFVADSSYSYFHIGNFYDNVNTIVDTTEAGNRSYYAIDDVSVTELLSPGNSLELEERVTIHPNPFTTKLKVQSVSENMEISKILISSLNGEIVMAFDFNMGVTRSEIDLSSLIQGTYILQIVTPKTTYYEKCIKL